MRNLDKLRTMLRDMEDSLGIWRHHWSAITLWHSLCWPVLCGCISMNYIFDENDFCRSCKGNGYTTEQDHSRGVTIAEDCCKCNGTGLRAVVIMPSKEGRE